MTKRKFISVLLILALAMSGMSVTYGADIQPQEGTPKVSNESADDGGLGGLTDGAVTGGGITDDTTSDTAVDEGVGVTTEEAIDDIPTTPEAVDTKVLPQRRLTPKAANFAVQQMNTNGNMNKLSEYATAAEANTAMAALAKTGDKRGLVVTNSSGKVINMISGIAYVKSKAATIGLGNTYITPNNAMHFYGVSGTDNNSATVGISGATVTVATSRLILVPEILVYPNVTGFYYRDYYTRNTAGDLIHYVYRVASPNTPDYYKAGTGKSSANGSFVVDRAPAWMQTGARYYSSNGISFYSDPEMVTGVGSDYYPYYKFLPYRNMSAYTSTNLNNWISYKTKSVSPTSKTSKLRSQGRNLVNAQNRYGVNSVMELAFACLESAYGKSNYALTRNNLFGINAVDSNPDKANSFSSVMSCINRHTNTYLSRGYGDAKGDSRYNGLTPGNKAVGVNVSYASDPWHGEKISGIAYSIDKYLGGRDYRKFTVGVTNNNSVPVYKSAGSTVLYNLSNKSRGAGPAGIPVIILGSSGNYYRIQSDMPINGTAKYSHTYYYSRSVAYVSKSDISVINNGSRTYGTQISANRDLRNLTVKVGKKDYLTGFNPAKTSYTVTVPKTTKKIVINGTRLMLTSKVTGNGTKKYRYNRKVYYVRVNSATKRSKRYKITVVRKGKQKKKAFNFGVYNSKTKLTNKSRRGRKTTAKRPMKIRTRIKTGSKRTTVKMVVYNSKKKVVASKIQYINKTRTVNFAWNGKYTKHNTLKKRTGRYALRSKKGTKYFIRFLVSRKGSKTQRGRYHTFYLYK